MCLGLKGLGGDMDMVSDSVKRVSEGVEKLQ